MELLIEGLLWFSVGMVVLTTIGYPILLAATGPWLRQSRRQDASEPTVTFIIAAHNEESCIAEKLENALAMDYPRDRLEIIVGSDGSTDRTAEIAESFADRGVIVRSFARLGKTGMQNQVVRMARGEILVFSDANAFYRPDAIRKLVRNFAEPTVACVSGQLVYEVDTDTDGEGENLYWSYEKFMKRRESALSSLIGVNGSIYAVRKSDYIEIDSDLISDLVEPLALVREGKQVVYEPEAVSIEDVSSSYSVEFKRKVRILTRSIKGVLHMRALFNPFRYGIFSFQLFMHKLLRYFVPAFLMIGFAALALLALSGRYQLVFGAAVIAVAGALIVGQGVRARMSNPVGRMCRLLYYYLMVNYALASAWVNVIRGTRMTVWVPERKGA